MGKYTTGRLKYQYKIKIDLGKLMECIADKLGFEYDEYYFEDDKMVIAGTEECGFKNWSCSATLESPAEDETDLIDSVAEKDIEQAVIDGTEEFRQWLIDSHKYISECEIDEDSYEDLYDEPDEDDAYDRWRDEQLEREYYGEDE